MPLIPSGRYFKLFIFLFLNTRMQGGEQRTYSMYRTTSASWYIPVEAWSQLSILLFNYKQTINCCATVVLISLAVYSGIPPPLPPLPLVAICAQADTPLRAVLICYSFSCLVQWGTFGCIFSLWAGISSNYHVMCVRDLFKAIQQNKFPSPYYVVSGSYGGYMLYSVEIPLIILHSSKDVLPRRGAPRRHPDGGAGRLNCAVLQLPHSGSQTTSISKHGCIGI